VLKRASEEYRVLKRGSVEEVPKPAGGITLRCQNDG
jgi:hypothetical protein